MSRPRAPSRVYHVGRDDSVDAVSTDHSDPAPSQGLGACRQDRRASAAARRLVPRGANLLEPYRGAGRQPAERAGGPALPRNPLPPARAVERGAVRAEGATAGGTSVPPHLRRVPPLPPSAGLLRRLAGAHLRPLPQ